MDHDVETHTQRTTANTVAATVIVAATAATATTTTTTTTNVDNNDTTRNHGCHIWWTAGCLFIAGNNQCISQIYQVTMPKSQAKMTEYSSGVGVIIVTWGTY